MLSKNVIKDIQSLSHKKHRLESGRFLAEGPKIVFELAKLIPEYFESIYSTEDKPSFLDNSGIEFIKISESELGKISQLQTPNQVVAILKQLPKKEPVIDNAFTLYLDQIQDPGNFGTIIRIADWFGITQIVCSSGCADLYNAKVVQSTMASIARVSVWYDESENWLMQQTIPILAATLHGHSVYTHDKINSGILLIGNESKGVRPTFQSLATHYVTIPRIGEAESLNAAVATGIILSHLIS
jgi:TrmH family RNA methyltransferase